MTPPRIFPLATPTPPHPPSHIPQTAQTSPRTPQTPPQETWEGGMEGYPVSGKGHATFRKASCATGPVRPVRVVELPCCCQVAAKLPWATNGKQPHVFLQISPLPTPTPPRPTGPQPPARIPDPSPHTPPTQYPPRPQPGRPGRVVWRGMGVTAQGVVRAAPHATRRATPRVW